MTTMSAMQRTKDSVEFGKRLKEARRERGLSQRDFAEMLGVHPHQVSKYEIGTSLPTVWKLFEMLKLLRVEPNALLGKAEISVSGGLSNLRLLNRLQDIETLPPEDQETLVRVIDAVVAQRKVRQIGAPPAEPIRKKLRRGAA